MEDGRGIAPPAEGQKPAAAGEAAPGKPRMADVMVH